MSDVKRPRLLRGRSLNCVENGVQQTEAGVTGMLECRFDRACGIAAVLLTVALQLLARAAPAQVPVADLGVHLAAASDARREQARALAASGKLAEALVIYDELTAAAPSDVTLFEEAGRAAAAAKDMRRVAVYGERRLKVDPGNYATRVIIPLAYRLAGDETAAARSRADFIAYWKASTDPKVRSKPFMLIDIFRAGAWTVNVIQCVEIGGDFGVGYVFDVWGPKAPPLPPSEVLANHRARIVLEHNRIDQKIMSETTHHDAPMRPTLDALSATEHTTLKWFTDEPSYGAIREIVGQYVAGNKALATIPPLGDKWSRITCQGAGS